MAKIKKNQGPKPNKLVKTPKLENYQYVGVNAGNRLILGSITVTYAKITDKRLEEIFKLDPRWEKYFHPIQKD